MSTIEYQLNDKEEKALNDFLKRHKKCFEKDTSAIGGAITYRITPTSVASVLKVQCNICHKEKDITDYDCW